MSALVYPESIRTSGDYIQFQFGEYKSPFKGGNSTAQYQPTLKNFTPSGESIFLYLPQEIASNFGGNWGGKDVTGLAQYALSTAGSAGGSIAKGKFKEGMDELMKAAKPENLKGATGGALADFLTALGNGFSGLPGLGSNLSANDVLQLTTENIVNPNTELLYGGSSLRTHGYSFKMIAQSSKEADDIFKIVDRFKKACAPKSKNTIAGEFRNFIGIPDLCQVTYCIQGEESKYLPKYKVSGITSVSVNYVTEGQFLAYEDGKPLGVVLTVALTETKLIFSEEIGDYR